MDERIVINTGPVIALGKMGCLYLLEQLPYTFITPEPVKREIDAGTLIGRPVEFPTFVEVVSLAEFPSKLTLLNLDLGEAAVIQAAIELNIERVCIDEVKGRRSRIRLRAVCHRFVGIARQGKAAWPIDRSSSAAANCTRTRYLLQSRSGRAIPKRNGRRLSCDVILCDKHAAQPVRKYRDHSLTLSAMPQTQAMFRFRLLSAAAVVTR